MGKPLVLVTHSPSKEIREAIIKTLGNGGKVKFLPDLADEEQLKAIRSAQALLTYDPVKDLGKERLGQLRNCLLIQCLTSGIDYLPLDQLPSQIPVAYNAGAFAEAMAEHVVAMAFAASKRLSIEHNLMRNGEFNQFVPTKSLTGGTCGIIGFGETGREVGRLMRLFDMQIEAINRSGKTSEPVNFIGTIADIDRVLARSDVIVITLALTKKTNGLIGDKHLSIMKPDAVLVNVARGEIIDETSLYQHLLDHPGFTACLEAWWVEPVRHGKFELNYPFLELPNVIASPHNSAMTVGALSLGASRAVENILRLFRGQLPNFIADEDIMMK